MPLEAQRCRHGAVAIAIVAIACLVTVGLGEQRAHPQKPMSRTTPRDGTQRRLSGQPRTRRRPHRFVCRGPAASRPRFLRRNVVQKLSSVVHVVCSLARDWHATIVLTTMSLSYAVQKSAAASSLKANRSSRHMSRNCVSTSRPRSRSDAAPRFISATPSAYFAAPRAKSSLDSSAICSASPIARSALSSASRTPFAIAIPYLQPTAAA